MYRSPKFKHPEVEKLLKAQAGTDNPNVILGFLSSVATDLMPQLRWLDCNQLRRTHLHLAALPQLC
ncbi:MAG: hypothetical protein SFV81_29270 [Pirellulaceae bacterium]|nr:hypothetical protein [Pirellulaceae bacterium]